MRLSLRLSSNMAPEEILAGARAARAGGMPGVWLADNPRERSSLISASVIAAREPGLDIGLGIISARERHPVVLAQEAVSLQSFSDGRVVLGLGVGTDVDRRLLGLPKRGGLGLLRETTRIVRELSAGSAIPAFDADLDDTVALKVEAKPLPVYIGAIGPKTLALAGEVADGVILSMGSTAAAAASAVAKARAARAEHGVADAFDVVCYVGFGGLDTEALTRLEACAAHTLREMRTRPEIAYLLEGTGVGPDEAFELLERRAHGRALPTALVDALTIGGSVEHCLERLGEYAEAGVSEVALAVGTWNVDLQSALDDVARFAAASRLDEVPTA